MNILFADVTSIESMSR